MAYDKRWDVTVSSAIEGGDGKHRHTRVGVCFLNDKGNLSIKIDPGVSISSAPGVYINGFLPREQPAAPGAAPGGYQQPPQAGSGYQQPPAGYQPRTGAAYTQRQPQPQLPNNAGSGTDNVPF